MSAGADYASGAIQTANLPSVAVVIPCWNAEQWIARAIQSVLDQNYPNLEIIIIDDGSTDGSLAIIKAFGNCIRYVTGPNRGACAARNSGLALTDVDYVLFLDADDYLTRGSLERWAEDADRQSLDILLGPFACETRLGRADSALPDPPYSTENILRQWVTGRFVPPCAVLWRRLFLMSLGGWNESLTRNQDGELTLRALINEARIGMSAHGCGVYVQHESQTRISKRAGRNVLAAQIEMFANLAQLANVTGKPHLQIYFGEALYGVAREAITLGHRQEGRQALALARKLGFRGHSGSSVHKFLSAVLGLRAKTVLAGALNGRRQRLANKHQDIGNDLRAQSRSAGDNWVDAGLRNAVPILRTFSKIRGFGRMTRLVTQFALLLGGSPVQGGVLADGTRMRLDLRSDTDRPCFYSGNYSDFLIALIESLLEPGGDFVDVGANIGQYTVRVGRKFISATQRVHAFEPVPSNFRRLKENIILNGVENRVVIHCVGLSDQSRQATMVLREDFRHGSQTGNASIEISSEIDAGFQTVQIPLKTLDEISAIEVDCRIEVIKIDVEGHEDKVIAGALRTISEMRPILIVEINKFYYDARNVRTERELESVLSDLEYRVFRLRKRGKETELVRLTNYNEFARYEDIILCPAHKTNILEAAVGKVNRCALSIPEYVEIG